jgi:hypothetical protein
MSENIKAKTKEAAKEEIYEIAELASQKKLPSWETAGLAAACSWKPGKKVSVKEFEKALALFRKRPLGGGKIKL